MKDRPPADLIVGTTDSEWPLVVFSHEVHAIDWLAKDPVNRHLWRVTVQVTAELRYVPPGEATLEEIRLT